MRPGCPNTHIISNCNNINVKYFITSHISSQQLVLETIIQTFHEQLLPLLIIFHFSAHICAIDHQRLSSRIPDGSYTCEQCSDSTVDVAHSTPFVDVHLHLLEVGVVKVGPMLYLVLHGAPSVVAAYKGEKLWVLVGITLQIIVDLRCPSLS